MAHMAMHGLNNMPTAMASGDICNPNQISGGGTSVPLERRCDNPDCNVYKMVSGVPQHSTPQFVTEPVVMEKPQLVNGFTTIFQIEGKSAKLSDIKNPDTKKPLYRIVPNTHAHIVNYVVVDPDTESLRKINENDPATMRKLLESQKQSADQMLKKLIAGHGIPVANVTSVNSSFTNSTPTISTATATAGTITPIAFSKLMPQQSSSKSAPPPKNPPLQLPTSIHPNLKITAVASAEGTMIAGTSVGSLLSQAKKAQQQQLQQQASAMPLITPVPLANLQRVPITTQSPISTPPLSLNMLPTRSSDIGSSQPLGCTSDSAIGDVMDKPDFDKMQQELKELRRTVALLAEAQAKSNQN